jgi:hypothetical protein
VGCAPANGCFSFDSVLPSPGLRTPSTIVEKVIESTTGRQIQTGAKQTAWQQINKGRQTENQRVATTGFAKLLSFPFPPVFPTAPFPLHPSSMPDKKNDT